MVQVASLWRPIQLTFPLPRPAAPADLRYGALFPQYQLDHREQPMEQVIDLIHVDNGHLRDQFKLLNCSKLWLKVEGSRQYR